jgi:hypothetical protein
VSSASDYQARFWFFVREPYDAWCKPNLAEPEMFCIKSLNICLNYESPGGTSATNAAAAAYCRDWSTHFDAMCAAEPALKRLKLIFDLTAVADAIKHVKKPVWLDFLLDGYAVASVPTERTWKLEERFCKVGRNDGKTHLVRLSGGIDFKTEMEFLRMGDVMALRDIVIRSRPSKDVVSWQLPLQDWVMPNATALAGAAFPPPTGTRLASNDGGAGCLMSCQSVVFEGEGGNHPSFTGFRPAPEPMPPLKGVLMRMKLTNESFRNDTSGRLNKLREQLQQPKDRPMVWPQQ